MPTALFQMLPWVGGNNTSIDESLIPPNQTTVADNVVYDTRGSKRRRDGIDHGWAALGSPVVGEHDYWWGDGTRNQTHVAVCADGSVWAKADGVLTQLTVGGTAWTGPLVSCSMLTFNNKVIIAVSGDGNVVKYWDGDLDSDVVDLAGAPQASILWEHQGRIFCNDKTNRDYVHWCTTANHTEWLGVGDSGGFEVRPGDGDPEGIVAGWTFRGDNWVAKHTKLYRVVGAYPEEWQVVLVSGSIGAVSHAAVAPIGSDDLMWVSEKGVHSLSAVQSYGDFSMADVSADIQRTFNDDIDRSRLRYSQAVYWPQLNSLVLALTEESSSNRVNTTNQVNNALYFFNIPLKAWYRWPDISCQTLCLANDPDKKRLYVGSHTGHVSKTMNGTIYDLAQDGTRQGIRWHVVTGQIFPQSNPYLMSGFKRFILYYRPRGTHQLTINVRVDNQSLSPSNSLSFSETGGADLLGSSFILGISMLGYRAVMGPRTRTIDGVGAGVKIEIIQSGIEDEAEIQGFGIEYEPAGVLP